MTRECFEYFYQFNPDRFLVPRAELNGYLKRMTSTDAISAKIYTLKDVERKRTFNQGEKL